MIIPEPSALMSILVTSPYREGAIVSIATGASRAGLLGSFYTTLYTPSLADKVSPLPFVGTRISKELRRRAFQSIPCNKVESFATVEEMLRVAAYRACTGIVDFPSGISSWVKERFDKAVAQQLRNKQFDIVVGMWGSSRKTFETAGTETTKVLNFVNSRPRCHNEYLNAYAHLAPDNSEMISPRLSAIVEAELALADIILVPSGFVAGQLHEYADKTVIQPYGVDLTDFSPGLADPRLRTNVLTLGQIAYRKGFTTFIEAAKMLPRLRFSAVGPIVAPRLLKALPTNLDYAGLVMHGDVASAMRSADVFVLGSFEDSYGLVAVEAMACGTAVILSDHAGAAELIKHGVNGFVFQAGNVQELCHYIELVVNKPDLRKRIAGAGRDTIMSSHSWAQYSSRVIDSIKERRTRSARTRA